MEAIFDINKIKEILPHRYPLLLVDRVTELERGKSIVAYKNITTNEEIFNGHFPIVPIYPGVYIIEGLAQAGGILCFDAIFGDDMSNAKSKIVYFMTIDDTKFRAPVVPGDRLVYKLEILKNRGDIWQIQGKAYVEDKLVAESKLKAMITDAPTLKQ